MEHSSSDESIQRLCAARAARAAGGWRSAAPAERGSKTKRPSAAERREQLLSSKSLLDGVCGIGPDSKVHRCINQWVDQSGINRCCTHELYSNVFVEAMEKLKQQRNCVLCLSQRARGRLAFEAMHTTGEEGAAFDAADVTIKYQIGSRAVCRTTFLSHFCISSATLKKLEVCHTPGPALYHRVPTCACACACARAPVRVRLCLRGSSATAMLDPPLPSCAHAVLPLVCTEVRPQRLQAVPEAGAWPSASLARHDARCDSVVGQVRGGDRRATAGQQQADDAMPTAGMPSS